MGSSSQDSRKWGRDKGEQGEKKGAQQQLSPNDVECVCRGGRGGGRRHEILGLLKSKLQTRLLSLALIEQAI